MKEDNKICESCLKREYCKHSKFYKEAMTSCSEHILDESLYKPLKKAFYGNID